MIFLVIGFSGYTKRACGYLKIKLLCNGGPLSGGSEFGPISYALPLATVSYCFQRFDSKVTRFEDAHILVNKNFATYIENVLVA